MDMDLTPEQQAFVDGLRARIFDDDHQSVNIGEVDQYHATSREKAYRILALHMIAGFFTEAGETVKQQEAAVISAMFVGQLTQQEALGALSIMANLVCELLVHLSNGSWNEALKDLLDSSKPLIPGRLSPNEDVLWLLDQELKPQP